MNQYEDDEKAFGDLIDKINAEEQKMYAEMIESEEQELGQRYCESVIAKSKVIQN